MNSPKFTFRFKTFLKRLVDVIISALILLLCLPLFAVFRILVWLEDRGPFFYYQERVGKNGRIFQLIKIRSMQVNELPLEAVGQVRAGNPMVTRVGSVVRRLKIDELPQLLNVLLGDMSLVGPRPTVSSQVSHYDETQARRLFVRPGLTGWAQVNGNTQLTWEERILLDLWYLDHWSFQLDLLILIRTIGVVIGGEKIRRSALEEAIAHANCPDRSS